MPRKAPAVIVDSGLALRSRTCMLLGSSVSFIQRRRLLVMELLRKPGLIFIHTSQAYMYLENALCFQVSLWCSCHWESSWRGTKL